MLLVVGKYELDESTFVIKAARFRHFVDESGMPWFVAKDVCAYLKLSNVSESCERVWPEYRRTELLLANRLTRAANAVLESAEDGADLEREAARLATQSAPMDL
jgi:prophage antirepressor-like protein